MTAQTVVLLDVELLQGYLDSLGKATVEKMFALYSQQVAIYLADIEKAQLADNAKDWQEHCHKMKGAAASVGLVELHKQLVVLEKITATQQEKSQLLLDLQAGNQQAMTAFSQWLAKQS